MQGTFDLPPETVAQVRHAVGMIRLGPLIASGPDTIPVPKTAQARARALDRQYAAKVAGHSNIHSLTQAWVSNNPLSTVLDQTLFTRLVCDITERVSRDWFSQNETNEDGVESSKLAMAVKTVAIHVRQSWEQYDNYHVSPRFSAAEDCIIEDLKSRGLFSWLSSAATIPFEEHDVDTSVRDAETLVFILRRSTALCPAFARAVGAHLLTQSIITETGNGRRMDHRRSYSIFENAFNALCDVLSKHEASIEGIVKRDIVDLQSSCITATYDCDYSAPAALGDSDPRPGPTDMPPGMWPLVV